MSNSKHLKSTLAACAAGGALTDAQLRVEAQYLAAQRDVAQLTDARDLARNTASALMRKLRGFRIDDAVHMQASTLVMCVESQHSVALRLQACARAIYEKELGLPPSDD